MTVSLTAPEVIDAGFLTTDLVDETGTKILKVDYSGTFEGQEIYGIYFDIGHPLTPGPNSSVDYVDGTSGAYDSVWFEVNGFAALIYHGSDSQDSVKATVGNDTLYGGKGRDGISGGGGHDLIFGGSGDDSIGLATSSEANRVYGGSGDDLFSIAGLEDQLFGGVGFDLVWFDLSSTAKGITLSLNELQTSENCSGVEAFFGSMTEHDDSLSMTLDMMLGRDLSQTIEGTYRGGAGTDTFILDCSAEPTLAVRVMLDRVNTVYPSTDPSSDGDRVGHANLEGWEKLIVTGTDFGDFFVGGGDDDYLSGGNGDDTVTGGYGTDTLIGGDGADAMLGKGADDLLYGGAGQDSLRGGESRDTLMGGDGADLIYGEGSTDSLDGGAGNDTLSGGYNDDTLTGGAGDDTFWFDGVRGTKNDLITDYGDGDRLNFAGGLTAADITVADEGDDLQVSWSTGTVLLLGLAGESVTMTFDAVPI